MVGVHRVGSVLFAVVVALSSCGGTSVRRNENGGDPAGGTAGNSGTGGTSSTETCERQLPEVDCDWRSALGAPGISGYCFKGGCHNATTVAGALDLTADGFLASRLLDVPAKHQIACPGNVTCDPALGTCAECAACPTGALLIDTADPESSWILGSMAPFIPGVTTGTLDIGCGDAMPTFNTTGTNTYSQAHKDCLREFFLALARIPGDWPCVP